MVGFAAAQTGTATDKQPAEKSDKAEKKAEKKASAKSASGTVKSASADSVVVAGKQKGKEAEWTFAVDPSTKIKKGGKDAAAADIQMGDAVQVKYSEKDGKMVAQMITVKGAKKAAKSAAKEEKKEEKK
jgi:uncharacterized protein DUF5666